MNTKTKKVLTSEPKSLMDQILECIDEYVNVRDAIVEDYIGGPGMALELKTAANNLRDKILFLDEGDPDFDKLLQQIKDLPTDDIKSDQLIEVATEADDFESAKLLNHVDPDDVDDYAISNGFCLIKVPNMNDRDKLEEFVTREIYPFVNDFGNFII